MSEFQKDSIINNLLRLGPLLVLFISVLNEIDLNYIKIFAFNFPFILIFYWSLRICWFRNWNGRLDIYSI